MWLLPPCSYNMPYDLTSHTQHACMMTRHCVMFCHVILMSVNNIRSLYASLGLASQLQKLLSSPWFGTQKACLHTCSSLQRTVFFHRRRHHNTSYLHHCPRARQSYTSKGIWRQAVGSFIRNSYVSTICPVVKCPYLCTSDITRHTTPLPPRPPRPKRH